MNRVRVLRLEAAGQDDLAAFRGFVHEAAADLAIDDDVMTDLVIAVDEVVTNIVRHGYRRRGGPVEVEIERTDDDILVRVRDEAPPFDPTTWPTPDLTLPLESRPTGGFGIHLTRSSVDRVQHRLRNGRGNELILVTASRDAHGREDRG